MKVLSIKLLLLISIMSCLGIKSQEISTSCNLKLISRLKNLRAECATYIYLNILCTLPEKLQNALADSYEANKDTNYCFTLNSSIEDFVNSIKNEVVSISLTNELWVRKHLRLFGVCAQAQQMFQATNTLEVAGNLDTIGEKVAIDSGILLSKMSQFQSDLAVFKFKKLIGILFLSIQTNPSQSNFSKEEALQIIDLLKKVSKLLDKYFNLINEGKNACYVKLSQFKRCNVDESTNTVAIDNNAHVEAANNGRVLQSTKSRPMEPPKDELFGPPKNEDDTFRPPPKLEDQKDANIKPPMYSTDVKNPAIDSNQVPNTFPTTTELPLTSRPINSDQLPNIKPLPADLKPTEIKENITSTIKSELTKDDLINTVDTRPSNIPKDALTEKEREYLKKMEEYNKNVLNQVKKAESEKDFPTKIPEMPEKPNLPDVGNIDPEKLIEMAQSAGLENLNASEKKEIQEKFKELDKKAQDIFKEEKKTVLDDLREIMLASIASMGSIDSKKFDYKKLVEEGFVDESFKDYCLNINKIVENPQALKTLVKSNRVDRVDGRHLQTADVTAQTDLLNLLSKCQTSSDAKCSDKSVVLNSDFEIYKCGSSNINTNNNKSNSNSSVSKGTNLSMEEYRKLIAAKIECGCGISVNLPPPPKELNNCNFASEKNKQANVDIKNCLAVNSDGTVVTGLDKEVISKGNEAFDIMKKFSKKVSEEFSEFTNADQLSNSVNAEFYLEDDLSELLSNPEKACNGGNFLWSCLAANESGFNCTCDKGKCNPALKIGKITPEEKKGIFVGIEELRISLVCDNKVSAVFTKEKKLEGEVSINVNKVDSDGERVDLEKIKNEMISNIKKNKDLYKEIIKPECKEKMDEILSAENNSEIETTSFSDNLESELNTDSDQSIIVSAELANTLLFDGGISDFESVANEFTILASRRRLRRFLAENSTKTEFRSSTDVEKKGSFENYNISVENESKIAGATPNKVPSNQELLRLYDEEEEKANQQFNSSIFHNVSLLILITMIIALI